MTRDIWAEDRLGRAQDAAQLATFLRNRSKELADRGEERAYVLNIDARWGDGKTFFLKGFQLHLKASGHLAVYVDAWKDDFTDDPLLAVMAAIDEEVQKHVEKRTPAAQSWAAVKASTGEIARLVGKGLLLRGLSLALTSGVATAIDQTLADYDGTAAKNRASDAGGTVVDEALKAVEQVLDQKTEEALSDFAATKKSIENFRSRLAEFIVETENLKGIASPFFVLIDELDRCRPPYAIAMLERVKHLFEIPGVVFVVATDSEQLVHSISAVYGAGFNGKRYLRRFFDKAYVFNELSASQLVEKLIADYPIDPGKIAGPMDMSPAATLTSFVEAMNLDLRSIRQIYEILRTIATTWEDGAPAIELIVMLPLIAAFYEDADALSGKKPRRIFSPSNSALAGLAAWHIPFGYRFRGNTSGEQAVKLGSQLWEGATDMRNVMRKAPEGAVANWLLERMRAEFDARQPVSRDEKLSSLILNYPKLIRQAGRLSDVVDDDETTNRHLK